MDLNVITSILVRGRLEHQRRRYDVSTSPRTRNMKVLHRWLSRHTQREVMSQGMQVTFRSCKRQGNGSSLRMFKRNTARLTHDFSPVRFLTCEIVIQAIALF